MTSPQRCFLASVFTLSYVGDLPLEAEMLLLGGTGDVVAVQRQAGDGGRWFPEPCCLIWVQESEERL